MGLVFPLSAARPAVLTLVVVAVLMLVGGGIAVLASGWGAASAQPGESHRQESPRLEAMAPTTRPVVERQVAEFGQGGPGVTPTPPQVLAVAAGAVPEETRFALSALKHVEKVAVLDAGRVRVAGVGVSVLAVQPQEFRAWIARGLADQPELWTALARGEMVADSGAVGRLGLRLGETYQIDGGPRFRVAASATFGLPGVDGVVSAETGDGFRLPKGVAVLLHARTGTISVAAVRKLLGEGAQVAVLPTGRTPKPGGAERPTTPATDGPSTGDPGGGRTDAENPSADNPSADNPGADHPGANNPAPDSPGAKNPGEEPKALNRPGTYLELYRQAATRCPGLSWTVLAAIGQVESSHGRNNGPSSAGAQGPMQFMPATWKTYGVDGDGDGVRDIWSPYDAVPGAANYLCANGAGKGGEKLRKAVWFYNHSWSYVDKVLGIAEGYARDYS